MLETLITSKTRIRILLKFFLNPEIKAYLRSLAAELNESSNAVRVELNRLEEAGMLCSVKEGNKKLFQVNKSHPLYDAINSMIKQHTGIDDIISNILKGLGDVKKVYLTGSLAKGLETETIDIILVGQVNIVYLSTTIKKIEERIIKKIRHTILTIEEAKETNFNKSDFLLIYGS